MKNRNRFSSRFWKSFLLISVLLCVDETEKMNYETRKKKKKKTRHNHTNHFLFLLFFILFYFFFKYNLVTFQRNKTC